MGHAVKLTLRSRDAFWADPKLVEAKGATKEQLGKSGETRPVTWRSRSTAWLRSSVFRGRSPTTRSRPGSPTTGRSIRAADLAGGAVFFAGEHTATSPDKGTVRLQTRVKRPRAQECLRVAT